MTDEEYAAWFKNFHNTMVEGGKVEATITQLADGVEATVYQLKDAYPKVNIAEIKRGGCRNQRCQLTLHMR